ncbi:MAG: FecR domain-containing protein [Fibrobacter sp.]|nr:FecR domain-containing protein [Fibrobacter sp.]
MMCCFHYLVILCCLFLVGADVTAQSESPVCRVKSIIGSVKIRRNGTVNWFDAKPKMPLRERDAIRTMMESEVELETDDGSLIKVSENSTIELSKHQQEDNTKNTKIKIMSGSIISNVKKLINNKSTFEFETPTATAAIRGTIVGLDVRKEATTIKVYEGLVYVSKRGARQGSLLNNNEMTKISRSTKVIVVEKLDPPPAGTIPGVYQTNDSTTVKDSTKTDSTKTDTLKIDTATVDLIKTDSIATDTVKVDTTKVDTVKINPTTPDSVKADTSGSRSINDTNKTSGTYVDSMKVGTTGQSGAADTNLKNVYSSNTASESILPQPLKLQVISPAADGFVVSPGDAIAVSGVVAPVTAMVSVNGRSVTVGANGAFKINLTAPQKTGDFELIITAESNGVTQNISRNILVKSNNLILTITSPKDGQIFTKPLIIISGSVTPGAAVSVMSSNVSVSASGTFTTQLPVANEEGEILLEFEAVLENKTQKVTRRVYYKPEYRFNLNLPLERQTVLSTTVQIKGEVLPVNSEVYVEGRKMVVTANGTFSGIITIPDIEGEVVLSIEINSGNQIKTVNRTIIYKRPPDTFVPQIQGILPAVSQNAILYFTVIDRTIDEEITFYYEVDGVKESETGFPNTPFSLPLVEGIHKYTVYAVDKAGNKSQKLSSTVTFLGKSSWMIKMRRPAGDIALDLPPSAPDGSYKPVYTVEFSIDNLPGDQMQLIREISVTNNATGQSVKLHTFTDTYNTVDINLKRKSTNTIIIEALDINNVRKNQKIQIFVR